MEHRNILAATDRFRNYFVHSLYEVDRMDVDKKRRGGGTFVCKDQCLDHVLRRC